MGLRPSSVKDGAASQPRPSRPFQSDRVGFGHADPARGATVPCVNARKADLQDWHWPAPDPHPARHCLVRSRVFEEGQRQVFTGSRCQPLEYEHRKRTERESKHSCLSRARAPFVSDVSGFQEAWPVRSRREVGSHWPPSATMHTGSRRCHQPCHSRAAGRAPRNPLTLEAADRIT